MTRLAEWIMRSPLHAALMTLLIGFSGVFSWATAVPAMLVGLRRGVSKATVPLAVAMGVAALHGWAGEPTLTGSLLASMVGAAVLRGTTSLPKALVSVAAISLGYVLCLDRFAGEHLEGVLAQYQQTMELLVQSDASMAEALSPALFAQLIGIWVCISAAVNLFMARSMQARLFHPGGFRQEFHGLRLTPALSALCLLPVAFSLLSGSSTPAEGIALVPVLLAGLGLVHGVTARKQWGPAPLVIIYAGLVLMAPVVTPVLLMAAMADSFFDFRQRLGGDVPPSPH